MYKKIISLLIVFAIVFTGGYYTAINLIPKTKPTDVGPTYATKPVTKGDVKVGVNTTGQLNAQYGGSVGAPRPEGIEGSIKYVVEEIFVKENSQVKKDDPLFRLSASNIKDLISKNDDEISKKQKDISKEYDNINDKLRALSAKLNRNITSISDVNPYDGIVITSPISGRITTLNAKEGEKITESLIGQVVNDSKFKISFKATVNEFPTLQKGQKVLLSFSGYEGYYKGVVKELNPNKVPNSDKISYVHDGVIEADNPGLIQPGTAVSISIDNNGAPGATLTYAGNVDSYLDQSKIFLTGFNVTDSKTYIATKVFVSKNEFVEKGKEIAKIAGSDIVADIQSDINAIKEVYSKIDTIRDEIAKINKGIANLNEFSNKLLVKAPNDGIVSWVRWNVGDSFEVTASSQQWDLEGVNLYNANQMSISTQVSDLDVNYVQVGSKVDVTVDAMPGKIFEGTVERMYQNVNREGKISYEVNISVLGGEGLKPGFSANCFISGGESLNTLIIPIEAVFEEDSKQKVEILKEDGTIESVEIEVGLMNDKVVEVLSGLQEGQKVVTGSSGDLMPSQSVDNKNSIIPKK
jgi:HlyD family secretion protein